MVKDIINSIYPTSNLSVEKIEALIEVESYDKRETFIERGKRNAKEYFVLEGICRSYVLNPEGQEITVSFFSSM
jgi:CRP-like cAMP-binding protein